MTSGYIDTNILLRVLIDDVPRRAAAARDWFAGIPPDSRPRVAAATASEVVFVLTGPRIARDRERTVSLVRTMLRFPVDFDDRDVLLRVLDLYARVHPDWDDCLVAAYALERTDGIVHSFGRSLDRIPGVTRIEPVA